MEYHFQIIFLTFLLLFVQNVCGFKTLSNTRCYLSKKVSVSNSDNNVENNQIIEDSSDIKIFADESKVRPTITIPSFSTNTRVAIVSALSACLLFVFNHFQPISGSSLLRAMALDSMEIKVFNLILFSSSPVHMISVMLI